MVVVLVVSGSCEGRGWGNRVRRFYNNSIGGTIDEPTVKVSRRKSLTVASPPLLVT